jgi:hypothetical protein
MRTLMAGFCGFIGGVSLLVGALLGLYAGASRRVPSLSAASRACNEVYARDHYHVHPLPERVPVKIDSFTSVRAEFTIEEN